MARETSAPAAMSDTAESSQKTAMNVDKFIADLLRDLKNKVDKKLISKFKEFDFTPIHFNANQIALIQSFLKPGGSEYKVLKFYELK